MSLTKAEIEAVDDLPREKLSVPEWGGHVYIRVLTGAEGDSFGDKDPSQATVVAMSICDKDGVRLFNDRDVELLQKKSGLVLRRIVEVAKTLNGLNDKGDEDIAKN